MQDLPSTRASLVLRLRETNDPAAWEEFCGVYETAVRRYARRRGLSESDADDATQEVLTSVFTALGRWKPDGKRASFRRWLQRVARNAAIDHIRRRARHMTAAGESPLEEVVDESNAAAAEAFEVEFRREAFRRAAERVRETISAKSWRAFWLTSIGGAAAPEAAAELEMSVGAVYTAKCRVLSLVRQEVEAMVADEEEGDAC